MGTAVAGRVGSRVDMDPDTARQHNPGTLSLLLLLLAPSFAPCVSTHRKTSKAFFFLFLFSFFYLAINFSIGASSRHTPTPPTGARSQFLNRAGPALNSVCATLLLGCAVLWARHVRPTRRVFSVSTASARRTTTARRNIYARESIEKFATRRATICASRYSIIIIR